MDKNNQNVAADEVATDFIGSLFAREVPATPEPTPTLAPATSGPTLTQAPAEKSAKLEQIVSIPISELEPFPAHPFQIRDDSSIRVSS